MRIAAGGIFAGFLSRTIQWVFDFNGDVPLYKVAVFAHSLFMDHYSIGSFPSIIAQALMGGGEKSRFTGVREGQNTDIQAKINRPRRSNSSVRPVAMMFTSLALGKERPTILSQVRP